MNNLAQKNKALISGILLGGLIVYLLSSLVVSSKLSLLKKELESEITIQQESLRLVSKNVAEGSFEMLEYKVVRDCSVEDRNSFDGSLSKLEEGLNKSELVSLSSLFGRCAAMGAINRSALVFQFDQNYQRLVYLVDQRKVLSNYDDADLNLTKWVDLLNVEKEISGLAFDLVDLQREIIDTLITGVSVSSDEAGSLREKGGSLRANLNEASEKARGLRESLLIIP